MEEEFTLTHPDLFRLKSLTLQLKFSKKKSNLLSVKKSYNSNWPLIQITIDKTLLTKPAKVKLLFQLTDLHNTWKKTAFTHAKVTLRPS